MVPKILIIAEIGSNHQGHYATACRLIEAAADAGANAVKFQLFEPDLLACRHLPQHEALQRTALPREWLSGLAWEAHRLGLQCSATPFDLQAVELLDALDVPWIKIASGDLTYHGLIRAAGATGRRLLISTGAASMSEVRGAYAAAMDGAEAAGKASPDITMLHCTVAYPCRDEDVNLRNLTTLLNCYGRAGFSDHTLSVHLPAAAVALGATVIEKHFTLERDQSGPDHGHSLEPYEFYTMVQAIRETETAMGSSLKRAAECELPMRTLARRGLYAARSLQAGETLTVDAIAALRPVPEAPDAVAVEDEVHIIGTPCRVGITIGGAITWSMLR